MKTLSKITEKEQTIREYHLNGKISYIETIRIISKEKNESYKNVRIHPKGYQWIRIGLNAKYYKNGQLAWKQFYNERGELISENTKRFRENGTAISF